MKIAQLLRNAIILPGKLNLKIEQTKNPEKIKASNGFEHVPHWY